MEDQNIENDNAERRRRISLDDSNYDNKIIHISGGFSICYTKWSIKWKFTTECVIIYSMGIMGIIHRINYCLASKQVQQ